MSSAVYGGQALVCVHIIHTRCGFNRNCARLCGVHVTYHKTRVTSYANLGADNGVKMHVVQAIFVSLQFRIIQSNLSFLRSRDFLSR